MSEDAKAALAEALRIAFPVPENYEAWSAQVDRTYESDAAAILAAMPGWRLVPAVPVDAERLARVRDELVGAAVVARNAEIAAAVRALGTIGGEIVPGRGLFVSRGAVLAIVETP